MISATRQTLLKLDGFALTLFSGTFVAAYTMLAWRYREVSIEIPMILNNERVSSEYKTSNELWLKVLIAAIILISIIHGVTDGIYEFDTIEKGTVPSSTELLILTITLWVSNALTVINGLVMIASIKRIHIFFIKNAA